jgi:hypothetical protein
MVSVFRNEASHTTHSEQSTFESGASSSPESLACSPMPSCQDKVKLNYGFVDANGKNNGNVMSWTASGSAGLSFTRSYTYDELNRQKTMSSTGTCTGLSWTYDIWANRTAQTTTGGTCGQSQLTVNNLNRIADTGFSYDPVGNLTAEPGKTYQYDAENRLKTINNGSVAKFVYNAAGQRVRKIASGPTVESI